MMPSESIKRIVDCDELYMFLSQMRDQLLLVGPQSQIAPGTVAGAAAVAELETAVEFSGHGFKLAPVMGAIGVELALDGHTSHPIHHLRRSRFDLEAHRAH